MSTNEANCYFFKGRGRAKNTIFSTLPDDDSALSKIV